MKDLKAQLLQAVDNWGNWKKSIRKYTYCLENLVFHYNTKYMQPSEKRKRGFF